MDPVNNLSIKKNLRLKWYNIYSYIHIFICSYIHIFICSYVHMFIYSYVHMFIKSHKIITNKKINKNNKKFQEKKYFIVVV